MRSQPVQPPPTEADGLRLYQALLGPVATATLDFARAYQPHLDTWLQAQYPRVSPDLCEEAVAEALHSLLQKPARFNLNQGTPLLGYLHMSAQRDLLNRLQREKRHAHQELDENCVVLGLSRGNDKGEEIEPLEILCRQEDEQQRQASIQAFRATLTPQEQRVLDLMLAGERANRVFAECLAVTHLPLAEQATEVQRVKDRIKKRALRWKADR